ncbi:MAG: helix-turn-helix transcriptional regulator [Hahellaceae bacterium]|nr:helix-turn-helix transcriptional regulator [Hahellaceae bacterium]MCP5168237.1 helix-turn-helix transcriptional regulator [Hahellaceae bacterium]
MGAVESSFSAMIKQWRNFRKRSQLDLALDAGVSQRHVSFLESGRAKPSRDMVLNLCDVLDLPLRERNQLLTAAGFAPVFKERTLDSQGMATVNKALQMMLDHHEPYPAIVVDRNWNMLLSNRAAVRFLELLGNQNQLWERVDPGGQKNVYRLTFHPQGMKPLINNWNEVSKHLMVRLQREVAADPNNTTLQNLLVELKDQASGDATNELNENFAPLLPMELGVGNLTLKIFSMISSFGTAQDVTADELKVETFFPADDFTTQFFLRLGN